jgi:hypothetical protein
VFARAQRIAQPDAKQPRKLCKLHFPSSCIHCHITLAIATLDASMAQATSHTRRDTTCPTRTAASATSREGPSGASQATRVDTRRGDRSAFELPSQACAVRYSAKGGVDRSGGDAPTGGVEIGGVARPRLCICWGASTRCFIC